MWFISGETMCGECGKPLDSTHDIITVTPHESGGSDRTGFYHRDCFNELPDKRSLIALWRENLHASVKARSESTRVLNSSGRFLAVFNSVDDSIVLYLLEEWAELRFYGPEQWTEFHVFLESFDLTRRALGQEAGELRSASEAYILDFDEEEGMVRMRWALPVEKELDFDRVGYEKFVAENGELAGWVDFGQLAESRRLAPVYVDGLLEKARGTIRSVKEVKDVWVVSIEARQETCVGLSPPIFEEFRVFARNVLP